MIRVFFEVPGRYRNSPGEVMGLIGPYRKRGGRPRGDGPPMGLNWTRGRGRRPPCLFPTPSLFPSFLLSYSEKGKGFLLGLGSPSRTPYSWHTPRWPASLPPSFIYMGRVLGNVVISKKFLRTRRIMVMHSNEREECVHVPS